MSDAIVPDDSVAVFEIEAPFEVMVAVGPEAAIVRAIGDQIAVVSGNFHPHIGALCGTTGLDGAVTVSFHEGKLLLENRTGECQKVAAVNALPVGSQHTGGE